MELLKRLLRDVNDGNTANKFLLTVGNLPGEEPLVLELDQDLKWREYQGREAGCVFHNDGNNMPGTPAVKFTVEFWPLPGFTIKRQHLQPTPLLTQRTHQQAYFPL
jgi:hypothetical protein